MLSRRSSTVSAVTDLERLGDLAARAVAAAADVVVRWRDEDAALKAERKGYGDYVTAADRAAEEAALAVLRDGAPEIAVRAEESAPGGELRAGLTWAVDPIDGTTNMLRGFPIVGVSVGLLEDGIPLLGAVASPFTGERWSGIRGRGAHDHRGRRLAVAGGDGRGVVATGFPFRRPENRPRYLAVFEAVFSEVEDLRRAGAASLDLTYTAAGTFDGFFELGLSLWDIAAGALLVLEAGGVVTDWRGDAAAVYRSGDILAGSPAWHERMLDLVRRVEVAVPRGAGA
jgi:myo-inositol-1(or 4)-monophosphatase